MDENEKIDPENCELLKCWEAFGEPDNWNIGSVRYARNLSGGEWVEFGDLPEETRKVLYRRIEFDGEGKPKNG